MGQSLKLDGFGVSFADVIIILTFVNEGKKICVLSSVFDEGANLGIVGPRSTEIVTLVPSSPLKTRRVRRTDFCRSEDGFLLVTGKPDRLMI